MFGDVWDWAGAVRTQDVNIGSPFYNVLGELQWLLDDLHSWSSHTMDMVEQSARLHHRAVQIHPFQNGNGRWSRLLSNIWLKLHGSPVVEWPESVVGETSTIREEYLAAVKAADDGDYASLIAMHRRYLAPDRPP